MYNVKDCEAFVYRLAQCSSKEEYIRIQGKFSGQGYRDNVFPFIPSNIEYIADCLDKICETLQIHDLRDFNFLDLGCGPLLLPQCVSLYFHANTATGVEHFPEFVSYATTQICSQDTRLHVIEDNIQNFDISAYNLIYYFMPVYQMYAFECHITHRLPKGGIILALGTSLSPNDTLLQNFTCLWQSTCSICLQKN